MKSFAVIGIGRFGASVARELYRRGNEVFVIDNDVDTIQRIKDEVTHAVVGDATEESVLRAVGVRNFDCVIVSIATNIQDSVLVTLLLKEMGVPYVVAKSQSLMHTKVLERIGADKIVFPEMDMGQRLAQTLTNDSIIDFIELSADFSIVEIVPPAKWVGRTLAELNVRARFGVNVLAIRGQDGNIITISPSADQVLGAGDILIVVGENTIIEQLDKTR